MVKIVRRILGHLVGGLGVILSVGILLVGYLAESFCELANLILGELYY